MMYIIIVVFAILYFIILKHKYSNIYPNFPSGPISLPVVGSIFSLGAKPHEKLSKLKHKYGNVVAFDFGTNRGIILNDLETIKDAYSKAEFQNRPHMEAGILLRGKHLRDIVFSSGKANEEQRAFAMKTLKKYGMGKKSIEHLLHEQLEILFKIFDRNLGVPIVNKELFQVAAVGALWSIMTGEQGKTEDSDFKEIMHDVSKAGDGFNLFTLLLPTLSKWFPNYSGWKNLIKSGSKVYNYGRKTIETHKMTYNADEEPKDLVEAYLQKIETTQDEKSTFFGNNGVKNLCGVLGDCIFAETVAVSLDWFLSVTLYYPNVQQKMQVEIGQVIGRNRLPCLADRQEMPYTESVIHEILRYSSVVPLGIPHATSEDVKLEGYLIPKGTVVMTNVYEALHDPKRWDEPETFKPERFLNADGSAVERSIANNIDIIFGHGKRKCLGQALTKDELFLFITGLSQRYTFQRDPKYNYGDKIKSKLSISLHPVPHTLIIQKR